MTYVNKVTVLRSGCGWSDVSVRQWTIWDNRSRHGTERLGQVLVRSKKAKGKPIYWQWENGQLPFFLQVYSRLKNLHINTN